jgi:hypothetical protein
LSFPRITSLPEHRREPFGRALAALGLSALVVGFVLVLVLALAAGPAHASAAAGPARVGDDPDSSTTTLFDDGDQRMIPRPNSGHAPEDAGDRGGALQIAVLVLIVVGVSVVGVQIFRQTRQREDVRS